MSLFLWVIFPYVCLTIFVVGHYWRYRYDKFGWTTRSSQLYEDRLLRWGSPLFHFGILAVFLGHVMGLGVPKSWTEAVGISEGLYHFMAVSIGALAGFGTVVGMTILIYRRRTVGPVFSATTVMDKVMYLFLATVILLGLWNTVASNILGHYDYRESVSVWFRGIFRLDLQPELMASAPLGFQAHALKSSSGHVGARRMVELAAALEGEARAGRLGRAKDLVDALDEAGRAARAALDALPEVAA